MTAAARQPFQRTTHQLLVEVIEWAAEAAREAVAYDLYRGDTPSEDFGLGLWQSFLIKFRKADGVDYDVLCTALAATYRSTVRECMKLAAERKGKS